jgi:hypothetical protein
MRNSIFIFLIIICFLFLIGTKSQSKVEISYNTNKEEESFTKIHSTVTPITDRIIKRRKIVLE